MRSVSVLGIGNIHGQATIAAVAIARAYGRRMISIGRDSGAKLAMLEGLDPGWRGLRQLTGAGAGV